MANVALLVRLEAKLRKRVGVGKLPP